MADCPAKLARLERFRRMLPKVSASSLAAVLKEAKSEGIPELTNRNAIREARDNAVDVQTPYGKLYQTAELHPPNCFSLACLPYLRVLLCRHQR